MSSTLLQAGSNSATFAVDAVVAPFRPSGYSYGGLVRSDWEKLPNGRLKDILNRSYGPVDTTENLAASTEAFLAAFFSAGGNAAGFERGDRPALGVIGDFVAIDLDQRAGNEGYPMMNFNASFYGSSEYPSYIRISLAYSASE